jgi:hypothetical protein
LVLLKEIEKKNIKIKKKIKNFMILIFF